LRTEAAPARTSHTMIREAFVPTIQR
jgi:hypothetical protein